MPKPEPERQVAAFDVGSNTVRAVAAQLGADRVLRVTRTASLTTALGAGLSSGRLLSREAIARTAAFVADFLGQGPPPVQMHCAGTAAARDADNAAELVAALREAVGVGLEVLSPRQEARLAYLGAVKALPQRAEARPLVADLGGRSTELAQRRAGRLERVSLRLGARALTEQCLTSDPPSRGQQASARRAARAALAPAAGRLAQADPLIAVGGTALTAALLLGRDRLSPRGLQDLRRRLATLPLPQRREAISFDPPRAEVIVAGLVILEELVLPTPSRRAVVSPGGVREGLLLERTGARGITGCVLGP